MFKIYNLFKIAVGVVALVTLAGCGGGGGASGTPLVGTGANGGSAGSGTISGSTALTINLIVAGGGNSSSIASGQSTVLIATVNNKLTGAVVANQVVTFAFSANISNANLTVDSANTSAGGQAATLYTAGNQSSGTDIVTATVTDAAGNVATASVNLDVQATTSNFTMTVSPNTPQNVSSNSVSGAMQTVNEAIPFTITVKDSNGNVVPNLTVTSALGSSNSAAYLGNPPVAVVPGFLTQSATVSPTLINTTDQSGQAEPTYISGGRAGTDIVIFTLTRNGIIIASQSVSVQVN
ncbi:hypothetical protein [Thiomonas intermedia]|uniref:hypothetical protein n=1 Tax=Thiomonas intermedia TaxID=926 RepID=UPI0012ABE465|nr:hypothetical protein [Thiomonas intermedia]